MNGYSKDLREKIVAAVGRGTSKSQTARTFGVSLSSVKRYVKKANHGESLAPRKSPGSAPKLDEKAIKLLEADLKQRPFVTLQERCDYIRSHGARGESLDDLPCRSLDWIEQEKGGRSATERDEFQRATWRVMVAAMVEPEKLVFVDECGVHTSLAPVYGYAPRGERLHLEVPRNRGKNTTLLSSINTSGMGSSLAVEGPITTRVFETYVEKVLVPSLRTGQIVVMDNLGAHRPRRIRELIEQQNRELLYLPAYSPDYNPIEESL